MCRRGRGTPPWNDRLSRCTIEKGSTLHLIACRRTALIHPPRLPLFIWPPSLRHPDITGPAHEPGFDCALCPFVCCEPEPSCMSESEAGHSARSRGKYLACPRHLSYSPPCQPACSSTICSQTFSDDPKPRGLVRSIFPCCLLRLPCCCLRHGVTPSTSTLNSARSLKRCFVR